MSVRAAPIYYVPGTVRIVLVVLAIIFELCAAFHLAFLPVDFVPLGLALFFAAFL